MQPSFSACRQATQASRVATVRRRAQLFTRLISACLRYIVRRYRMISECKWAAVLCCRSCERSRLRGHEILSDKPFTPCIEPEPPTATAGIQNHPPPRIAFTRKTYKCTSSECRTGTHLPALPPARRSRVLTHQVHSDERAQEAQGLRPWS